MRIPVCGLIVSLMFIPCGQAEIAAGSGAVTFKGRILARSCDVKESDRNPIILLGEHDKKLFTHSGDVSPEKSLNITLINCQVNPHTHNMITLGFKGETDANDAELLKLASSNEQGDPLTGIASGIAIELLDANNQRIALNSTIAVPMQKGETPLPTVKLRYRATQVPVTPGEANAVLWLRLRYEE